MPLWPQSSVDAANANTGTAGNDSSCCQPFAPTPAPPWRQAASLRAGRCLRDWRGWMPLPVTCRRGDVTEGQHTLSRAQGGYEPQCCCTLLAVLAGCQAIRNGIRDRARSQQTGRQLNTTPSRLVCPCIVLLDGPMQVSIWPCNQASWRKTGRQTGPRAKLLSAKCNAAAGWWTGRPAGAFTASCETAPASGRSVSGEAPASQRQAGRLNTPLTCQTYRQASGNTAQQVQGLLTSWAV